MMLLCQQITVFFLSNTQILNQMNCWCISCFEKTNSMKMSSHIKFKMKHKCRLSHTTHCFFLIHTIGIGKLFHVFFLLFFSATFYALTRAEKPPNFKMYFFIVLQQISAHIKWMYQSVQTIKMTEKNMIFHFLLLQKWLSLSGCWTKKNRWSPIKHHTIETSHTGRTARSSNCSLRITMHDKYTVGKIVPA